MGKGDRGAGHTIRFYIQSRSVSARAIPERRTMRRLSYRTAFVRLYPPRIQVLSYYVSLSLNSGRHHTHDPSASGPTLRTIHAAERPTFVAGCASRGKLSDRVFLCIGNGAQLRFKPSCRVNRGEHIRVHWRNRVITACLSGSIASRA